MRRPAARFLISTAFLLASAGEALSESIFDDAELSGLLRSDFAIDIETGETGKAEFTLMPELNLDLSSGIRFTAIGRLRGETEDALEPGRAKQSNRSEFSRRVLIGDDVDFELREAYIDTEIGATFLRLGKQQVVWGQADGLKVLDVLNPQSFREFVLADFEDSRIPLWTVNAEVPVGDTFLQVLWIPDRTYDDIPEPGAAFAFTSPLIVPEAPPGVPVTILSAVRPDNFIEDSDVGVKLSAFLGGWDLSLNYAWHYFDRPVVRRQISDAGILISQGYERTHLVGGTFANVFDDFTVRGEIGLSSDRYFFTRDLGDADGVIRSSEVSYVFGFDYQGWTDWFVSTQIFQSVVIDPVFSLARDKVDSTATFLVRRNFMNEILQADVLSIHSLNGGDGLVQASLSYEWRSNVRLEIGADIFYGDPPGLFGQFDEMDRISMGVEVGF